MNTLTATPSSTATVDEDLAERAKPGHGIPSMDTNVSAQILLEPDEAEREAKTALTGGGSVAGAATGAAIGVKVAGPVGVMVGATLGAVAGALGGVAAGAAVSAADSNSTGTSTADTAQKHTVPADAVHLHIDDTGGGAASCWLPRGGVRPTGLRAIRQAAIKLQLRRAGRRPGTRDGPMRTAGRDAGGFLDGRGRSGALYHTTRRIAPFEGSGQRTHRTAPHSQLVIVNGAPHGFNLPHAQVFNDTLLDFLRA